MTREQLEHLIRAAGAVTNMQDMIIIGSQAILGTYPDAPEEAVLSREGDMYPRDKPEDADKIEGALGQLSAFDEQFGIYADGVGPETAALPSCWQDRLVRVANDNTNGYIGWCLDPCDLVAAKLIAGREKDYRFAKVLLDHGLVSCDVVVSRVAHIPDSAICGEPNRQSAHDWLFRWKRSQESVTH